jgi:hypothetical protein
MTVSLEDLVVVDHMLQHQVLPMAGLGLLDKDMRVEEGKTVVEKAVAVAAGLALLEQMLLAD